MKILTVIDEEGKQQTCNERCYDAYDPKCTCVCKGLNHGKGLIVAREQTFELFESILNNLGPGCTVKIPDKVRQEELFK